MLGIDTVTRVGTSVMTSTFESLFLLGYSQISTVANLFRFPMDAFRSLAYGDQPVEARVTVAQVESPQVCPELEILAAYAEANLTARERAVTEGHLVQCLDCRRTVALAIRGAN
jgi:hypothetical protein